MVALTSHIAHSIIKTSGRFSFFWVILDGKIIVPWSRKDYFNFAKIRRTFFVFVAKIKVRSSFVHPTCRSSRKFVPRPPDRSHSNSHSTYAGYNQGTSILAELTNTSMNSNDAYDKE